MKRNKYYEKEKDVIRIQSEGNEIWEAIRNQAWVELDEPIPNGWYGDWVLRDDISRSPEAENLNYIIDKWGRSCWSRRKDFKMKPWKKKYLVDIRPSFSDITEGEYLNLNRTLQKYFVVDNSKSNAWRTYYYVYIEPWKFEMETCRGYTTHYREHDEILYQMQAENKYELYNTNPHPWHGYSSMKWWKRCERRKAKGKIKRENIDIIKAYNCDMEIDKYDSPTYKTAAFDWYW